MAISNIAAPWPSAAAQPAAGALHLRLSLTGKRSGAWVDIRSQPAVAVVANSSWLSVSIGVEALGGNVDPSSAWDQISLQARTALAH